MRQACLCLDPPRFDQVPPHGAHAALVRILFLNRAAARTHKRGLSAQEHFVALARALSRAKKVYLYRIKTLGVTS